MLHIYIDDENKIIEVITNILDSTACSIFEKKAVFNVICIEKMSQNKFNMYRHVTYILYVCDVDTMFRIEFLLA